MSEDLGGSVGRWAELLQVGDEPLTGVSCQGWGELWLTGFWMSYQSVLGIDVRWGLSVSYRVSCQ